MCKTITIIGSGNVAWHLARLLTTHQLPLTQVFGRNTSDLKAMSEAFNIPYSTEDLPESDLYILCVKDDAVAEMSRKIIHPQALVVHTAGALPMEALQGEYRKGVLYPLQTFSKKRALEGDKIPFFIEAETENDEKILMDLAKKISDKVALADFEKRKHLHLTAVFACNFVNHLFTRAKEMADEQNIPFSYFFPLIEETFEKIHTVEPRLAQTGPAARGDQKAMDTHRGLIQSEMVLELYETLSRSIMQMYLHDN